MIKDMRKMGDVEVRAALKAERGFREVGSK